MCGELHMKKVVLICLHLLYFEQLGAHGFFFLGSVNKIHQSEWNTWKWVQNFSAIQMSWMSKDIRNIMVTL